MRFLLINYEYPPIGAGAATATQAIANNLVTLGHNVTVLTARYRGLPEARMEGGVLVRRVRSLRRYADRCSLIGMAGFVVSASFSLASIIRKDRPEASIAFFSIPCGPVALMARIFFGLPYVISLRGGDVPGLTPEVKGIHRALQPLRCAVLEHAEAIVANADGLRQLSETSDPFKVSVIPNGVDTEFFHPTSDPARQDPNPFRIVFTGRFQSQKNVSLLLEQCAAVSESSPTSIELHLVGDGPLRTELQEQANTLGLADRITWHGWTARDQLRAIYQESHCFVNPSFYEGMPNAVLEAMACGKPIIASRVAGNDAVVRHGTTGFLFPLEEPAALGESLRTMINNPARAHAMGLSGREWAKRDFSWNRVAAAYAGLFEQAA